MTTAEFASGKATWVLNGKDNSLASQAKWFQNLEENPDAYPVMDGTHGKVYYLEENDTYSNHPGSMEKMRFHWYPVPRLSGQAIICLKQSHCL